MRSSSLYWIILTSVAFLLLIVSYLPGVQGATQPLHREKEKQRAAIVAVLWREYESMRLQTFQDKLQHRLELLERENRMLYAALATVSAQRDLLDGASVSATRDASRSGVLSRDLSGWFVIQETPAVIAASTLIYQDGVVIGEVNATSSAVIPVVLVSKRNTPMLVMHQPTALVGTLTIQGQTPNVEFFQRVEGIAVGDLFTTLPTRNLEHAAALGTVASIQTQPSDPVSVVQLQFIAHPGVGERVEVGQ